MGGSSKSKDKPNYRKKGDFRDDSKAPLPIKEEGQAYAAVLRLLGNRTLEAQIYDTTTNDRTIRCHIRGQLHKVKLNSGDTVLLNLRDYQEGAADVVLRYNDNQIRRLREAGELPDYSIATGTNVIHGDDEDVEFTFQQVDDV